MLRASRPVRELDASVEVLGPQEGDPRNRRPPLHPSSMASRRIFTDPVPFTEMEVRYDRAYGGSDSGACRPCPSIIRATTAGQASCSRTWPRPSRAYHCRTWKTPMTCSRRSASSSTIQKRWNQQPLPQGFGWFQKTWYPRCSFAGAMPPFVTVDTPIAGRGARPRASGANRPLAPVQAPEFRCSFQQRRVAGACVPLLGRRRDGVADSLDAGR